MFKLTNILDIQEFTTGCCFFGAGGGGNTKFGEQMLQDALDADKEICIIQSNEVSDNDWLVCPYLMGTSGPETSEVRQEKNQYGLTSATIRNMPAAATNVLLKNFAPQDTQLDAIIPYEIGAAATASAVATAALLNIPAIDADFVGRSVPEATQMLPALYGMDLCPTACVDAFGNTSVLSHAVNRRILERMGKHLASAAFGLIGQATLLTQAKNLKPYMLTGTLSRALAMGKILNSKQLRADAIESKLYELSHSKKIFTGNIMEFHGVDEHGYFVGEMLIRGDGLFTGSNLKIWFKNENHMAWQDEKVLLTSPNLISIVDKQSYQPYVNNELAIGMSIAVFGTPAHKAWRQKIALEANCPRYYGFDCAPKLLS